jgi:hypothetical protein
LFYSYVTNQIEFRLGETYSTNPNSTVAPMTLKDQWVHIAATRKLSAQTTIYINGVQAAQTTNSVNPIYVINHLAYIGASYYSFSQPFYTSLASNGVKIDSIQTWDNVELDQSAITELYNNGNGQEYIFTSSNVMIPSPIDSLGNYNGTAQGDLAYNTSRSGYTFNLNGTNAYVQLPNNTFNFTNDFSFSLWVNFNGSNGVLVGSTGFGNNTSPQEGTTGWNLIYSSGYLTFNIFNDNTNSGLQTNLLPLNTWSHIVITSKSGSNKIYINGVSIISNTSTMRPNYRKTVSTRLGVSSTSLSSYFLGKMDEVYAWDREITADEVIALYSGTNKYYPFTNAFDYDAQSFITNASITDTVQQNAINALVIDLKGYGIWTKMKALYPMIGGTEAQHRFNLKDPRPVDAAFYLDFIGTWAHSPLGAKPDGLTGYANAKINLFSYFAANSLSHSTYVRLNSFKGVFGGVYSPVAMPGIFDSVVLLQGVSNTSINTFMGNTWGEGLTGTVSALGGMIMGNRDSSTTVFSLRKNTTTVNTSASFSVRNFPSIPYYIGALNDNGTARYFDDNQIAFYHIGDGLTATEATNFYNAVQTFNTTLGRPA